MTTFIRIVARGVKVDAVLCDPWLFYHDRTMPVRGEVSAAQSYRIPGRAPLVLFEFRRHRSHAPCRQSASIQRDRPATAWACAAWAHYTPTPLNRRTAAIRVGAA